jgi:hypothetical protein
MNAVPVLAPIAGLALLAASTLAVAQTAPSDAVDVNRDGVVSQAEAEYSTALRLQFDDLDRNRDGRLDPTEISGLAPAPPGAVPVLPESALGRPAGTVTPGGGTAGVAADPRAMEGALGATRNRADVPGSAAASPPSAPAVPGSPASPTGASPFGSPFATNGGR